MSMIYGMNDFELDFFAHSLTNEQVQRFNRINTYFLIGISTIGTIGIICIFGRFLL